jgi:hypothetical protein
MISMFLQWPNGVLSVGPICHAWDAWGIELAWNRRELLGDKPQRGEVTFADYKALIWFKGDWLPRYTSRSLPWRLS